MTNLTDNEYKFTTKWFDAVCYYWPRLFANLQWDSQEPKVIIEIGSFEGRATCWILENLIQNRDSRVYCLDTFAGGEEHQNGEFQLDSLFERFMHNVLLTGKEELVEVLVGDSKYTLCDLVNRNISCDFIYVDGSHIAKDVLADAVLAWILLKSGGLMIFDDHLWGLNGRDILSSPKFAIDGFVNCYIEDIEILHTGQNYQLCLKKK
jgi:predicted O-methyltransferase YrrM